jgi:exodeoxyribonuclease V alpha subunit
MALTLYSRYKSSTLPHAEKLGIRQLNVQFAERKVCYDYADIRELALAWAVMVHKAREASTPLSSCHCSDDWATVSELNTSELTAIIDGCIGTQWRSHPSIIMQHYIFLSRNLSYTGLTHAKQLVILVGPTKAIGVAINCIMDRQHYTALADRLRGCQPSTEASGTQCSNSPQKAAKE